MLLRRQRILKFLGVATTLTLFLRCATEPGTSTPVTSGAVTFTYANGNVRVITQVVGTTINAAAVLFDTNPVTGELSQATDLENGVTVTWPEELSFELPECSESPELLNSKTYSTYKIFNYLYPETCTPPASEDLPGQATLVISKDGNSRTLNDTTSEVTEQTFTSSGTWTAPPGVTSVTVECWGGGGAGGLGGAPAGLGGSGGGGGAYSKKNSVSVTPGVSYTVNVGSGGVVTLGDGGNGGDSWFSNPATVLAKGGEGGEEEGNDGGSGGDAGFGIGDTKFSGGDGADDGVVFQTGGGGGSSAGTSTNGSSVIQIQAGGVAPANGGDGGNGGNSGAVGSPGESPGGGGGGGGAPGFAAGAGAAGKIILDW